MDLTRKLAILADAAKYDASCASSGTDQRDSRGGAGMGSTEGMGICHSYAPDGRCISLLKILLTNHCQYDCLYCVNRSSSNVARAKFSEIVFIAGQVAVDPNGALVGEGRLVELDVALLHRRAEDHLAPDAHGGRLGPRRQRGYVDREVARGLGQAGEPPARLELRGGERALVVPAGRAGR